MNRSEVRRRVPTKKIIQVIPAVGWSAMYLQPPTESDGPLFTIPLSCWALVENGDGNTNVVGMCAWERIDYSDTVEGFYGYLGPGVNLREYVDAAREEFERRQRRNPDRSTIRSD